jgi:hypothetical protein
MDRLDLFSFGMFIWPLTGAEGRLAWHASGNYSLVEVSASCGSMTRS